MDYLPVFEGHSTFVQSIGFWAARIWDERGMIQMYTHLVLAALFPIYIGSYASLRCPGSAEEPSKKNRDGIAASEDDDDEDEDDLGEHTEFGGLTPSDAILFPILAGCVLAGLYFLIKWLKDPTILNRILGYYFSSLGIFGVGILAGDSLNVATTFVFPKAWSSGKDLYYVDSLLRQQLMDEPAKFVNRGATLHRKFTEKTNPFPGALSNIKFSEKTSRLLWSIRNLFSDHWFLRAYVHGLLSTKAKLRLNTVIGLMLGLGAIALYNFHGKAWWLTNLMGWGFCYNTLQFMSPTTFWTGTLVLSGLFVYDITMVFYT
jgi:minor histocompatibility antigen H13